MAVCVQVPTQATTPRVRVVIAACTDDGSYVITQHPETGDWGLPSAILKEHKKDSYRFAMETLYKDTCGSVNTDTMQLLMQPFVSNGYEVRVYTCKIEVPDGTTGLCDRYVRNYHRTPKEKHSTCGVWLLNANEVGKCVAETTIREEHMRHDLMWQSMQRKVVDCLKQSRTDKLRWR